MKTEDLKNMTFWAREFRLPLFWLTDKDHKIVSKNSASRIPWVKIVIGQKDANRRITRATDTDSLIPAFSKALRMFLKIFIFPHLYKKVVILKRNEVNYNAVL